VGTGKHPGWQAKVELPTARKSRIHWDGNIFEGAGMGREIPNMSRTYCLYPPAQCGRKEVEVAAL